MSIILDSSIAVDILRHVPAAVAYARELQDQPICSEITRVEILQGVRSHERRESELFFERVLWIGLDEPIARRAGELGRTYGRSHPGISTADLVIAATAQELGRELATRNVKHFPMFKGLRSPYRA